MHNKEYYFENSFAILIHNDLLPELIEEVGNLKCKECGAPLFLVQWMEGPSICCSGGGEKGIYAGHEIGYDINMDFPRHEKKPFIEIQSREGFLKTHVDWP